MQIGWTDVGIHSYKTGMYPVPTDESKSYPNQFLLQWRRGGSNWVLVLEGLVAHYRTIQLQLLQHYWLGHRLRLL